MNNFPSAKKNIYLLQFKGQGYNAFLPVLWPSAKTYYELHGSRNQEYNWILPTVEFLEDLDEIKQEIRKAPPDIFGVSLYVWNYELSLEICEWVKATYPNCLVITGGPQQYLKHDKSWFEKHYFIDASLPSETYGEIAIFDLLENLNPDNTVDFTKVEKICFPSKDRKMFGSSTKSTYKLNFNWNFSGFTKQKEYLDDYVSKFNSVYPKQKIHLKLETTRGCPYQCTFCDWGGGVGTKVVLKDLEVVKQDIDTLIEYDSPMLYICDANFGINKERDIEILKFCIEKQHEKKSFPYIEMGGVAKTNKHFKYIREIYELQAKHNLASHHKISVQTFDKSILDNIKRTDLRVEEHWELANYMEENYAYQSYVELIAGLPGITVDKWYEEFTIPYNKNSYVMVYEWHLLPEAEAYSSEYRNKYGIGTAKKLDLVNKWSTPNEIVVESYSFNRDDYKEMWKITNVNHLFRNGSIYPKSVKQILERNKISFGQFLKMVYEECYEQWVKAGTTLTSYQKYLDDFVSEEINNSSMKLYWNNDRNLDVSISNYMIMEYYKNFNIMDPILQKFLLDKGADKKLVQRESNQIIHEGNSGKIMFKNFRFYSYKKYKDINEFIICLRLATSNFYPRILVA